MVHLKKNKDGSNERLIRSFTRSVQNSGLMRLVKDKQFASKSPSANKKKAKRLRSIRTKAEKELAYKQGKLKPRGYRGRS